MRAFPSKPTACARRRAVLAALAIAGCAMPGRGTAPETPEQEAVRACFEAFKRAIVRRNGAEAVTRVSRATLDYYGRMRDLALTAPAARVRGEGLVNRMWIVTLRHRLPPERLAAMEPDGLFRHAVDEGWLDGAVASETLGEVRVDGAVARAERRASRRDVRDTLFTREGGRWRLDLVADLPAAEAELREVADEHGITEDELVLALVQAGSRVEVPETIWDPPPQGAAPGPDPL